MGVGDRVRLHISPGHRDALGLPEEIGTVRAIETSVDHASILVRFKDLSVYVSPIAETEVEIVQTARKPR